LSSSLRSSRNRLLHGCICAKPWDSLHPEPGTRQRVDMRSLADLDYFVPNESEAETITGIAVRNVEDAVRCADKLLAGGIRRVIITLGANGSLLAGRGVSEHLLRFRLEVSTALARAMHSLGVSPCSLRKEYGTRGSAARQSLCWISTTGVGTQNPSMIARVLMQNGLFKCEVSSALAVSS